MISLSLVRTLRKNVGILTWRGSRAFSQDVRSMQELLADRVDSLKGKTVLITGGSNGIGLAIGKKVAGDGANVVIAARSTEPTSKNPNTIYTAAKEIQACGGNALPVVCDIRNEEDVTRTVEEAVKAFGGIDIVINNASVISMTSTERTPIYRYDLMQGTSARGAFLVTQKCLPHLRKSSHAHVLNITPALNMNIKWFKSHLAHTMAKYGESMCVLGMSAEFSRHKIAVNGLWPRKIIATPTVSNLFGEKFVAKSRSVEIMSDAAYAILTADSTKCTGHFFLDDECLKAAYGVTDFTKYHTDPSALPESLFPSLFV